MNFNALKKATAETGEEIPVKWERMFYDLSKGLLKGVQTKEGKTGNILKSAKTISKEFYSNDVDEIVKMLFGANVTPKDVLTFEGALAAINSNSFPYKSKRKDILKLAAEGIANKGLKIPDSLRQYA